MPNLRRELALIVAFVCRHCLVAALHTHALGLTVHSASLRSLSTFSRAAVARMQAVDDGGDDEEENAISSEEADAFRAQLLRQFGGDAPADETDTDNEGDHGEESISSEEADAFRAQLMSPDGAGNAAAQPDESSVKVELASTIKVGRILVAHPQRFCSRNPFSRPVDQMERFGLQGPVVGDDLVADVKAQMLPVLFIVKHSDRGTAAVLLERRTGALMGDISMDDYGCVAISPLWLGGTAEQNSLYVLHNCEGVDGAKDVGEGIWLGGWQAARPKVADSTFAESRFKFFLGSTAWAPGQLQKELDAGAWICLDVPPEVVMKDRVIDWRPGKPKPIWTELLQLLRASDPSFSSVLEQVYTKGQ